MNNLESNISLLCAYMQSLVLSLLNTLLLDFDQLTLRYSGNTKSFWGAKGWFNVLKKINREKIKNNFINKYNSNLLIFLGL